MYIYTYMYCVNRGGGEMEFKSETIQHEDDDDDQETDELAPNTHTYTIEDIFKYN